MKIIIAGAGEVGYHIAKLLSNESQNITVIDMDKEKLSRIEHQLDVLTHRGDCASFNTLVDIGVQDADILIAVTQLQNTNLMSALIAKKLGCKKVIARVTNPEFLERRNRTALERAGIDMLISPEELAANEIFNLVEESIFSEVHSFDDGALNLLGVTLSSKSTLINKTVKEASEVFNDKINFIPILIIRTIDNGYETIIPRGQTTYLQNDHVYFIALETAKEIIYQLVGKVKHNLSDVMVLGGGRIGTKTAQLLKDHKHDIKIIEYDKTKAYELADEYHDIMVLHGDGRDSDLLEEEGISEVDAFVAVTGRSETNIMACLLAKSRGVKKTIALVENMDYIHLSQEIGIDGFINKKLMAANAIFKHIRRGKVLDVTNLYDLKAEVLEYRVDESSKIAHKRIEDLQFPNDAIIGGIVRNGKGFIPTQDFEIKPLDRVVVFSQPQSLAKVEEFFET
ncbi:Trk system potassium transporter TrkA [Flavobacteriaceae bacterium Ap0902]|nr:Trk system potassium transporter TrkA [Flavobacteriaceae bacterium Ap0902]